MNTSLVSVVMAVRNGERFLAKAIESVLAQTHEAYEIIVVDNQSTDNTKKIAKFYQQVRYLCQTGQGIADAYNIGIDAAKGEFIAFLSHDDLWTPEKLSVQANYLLNHPEIQYTTARIKFFLEPGYVIPSGFRPELLEGDHVGCIMETLVARKQLFDLIGKFDLQLTTAEDVDWFARATDSHIPMAVMPQVLLYKRVHNTNLSINSTNNNQNLLKILRRSVERKRNQVSAKS